LHFKVRRLSGSLTSYKLRVGSVYLPFTRSSGHRGVARISEQAFLNPFLVSRGVSAIISVYRSHRVDEPSPDPSYDPSWRRLLDDAPD
jgi:hypothetical protein